MMYQRWLKEMCVTGYKVILSWEQKRQEKSWLH